jgi:hypothetical protein
MRRSGGEVEQMASSCMAYKSQPERGVFGCCSLCSPRIWSFSKESSPLPKCTAQAACHKAA